MRQTGPQSKRKTAEVEKAVEPEVKAVEPDGAVEQQKIVAPEKAVERKCDALGWIAHRRTAQSYTIYYFAALGLAQATP